MHPYYNQPKFRKQAVTARKLVSYRIPVFDANQCVLVSGMYESINSKVSILIRCGYTHGDPDVYVRVEHEYLRMRPPVCRTTKHHAQFGHGTI